jgi:biopolymer transport protein ExbD
MSAALETAQEEVKPDMTPMIDCVFLMIIFFICIDFKVLESKLPAYLPKDKGSQSFKVEPQEQLSVLIIPTAEGTKAPRTGGKTGINPETGRPYAVKITGHKFKWQVGPREITDLDRLKAELTKIANDKSTWQKNKDTGVLQPMDVVIEPMPGSYYDDVAKTVDAVKAAGFENINFGGGLGALPQKK